MKKVLIGVLFILAVNNISGQEQANNEDGSWFTFVNKFKVTEKLYFLNVTQWRQVDFASSNRIFLVMPSVNYKFNKKIGGGIGFTYVNFNQVGIRTPSLDYENRFWQHVTLYSTFEKIKMNQRFMLEERWKKSLSGKESYSNRFRYRIILDRNLVKFKNDKYLLGRLCNEFRVRFGSGFNEPEFDQNNFSVLIGYKVLENSKLYLGYGRNYYKSGNGTYWGDHLLHVNFSYDFDLRKKSKS